ncbi:hypothetical protein NKI48_34130 [Mesorhizobium sp. M0644]|uniref:hypothetical protein n=1 Tax=Mesorhizobium sp. M0644 TaxID=2956979 RepID=UPI003337ECFF
MVLSPREREAIASNVLSIIHELFVHRRMKTVLHGIDVVPLLDSLRRRAAKLSDVDFHRAMRSLVNNVRDRHTRYSYASTSPSYSLPFVVERGFEAGSPAYLVTKSTHPDIKVGSIIERWNNVPVELVVRELAEDIGASNDSARRALAVRFVTARRADRFDPPAEQAVNLDLRLPNGSSSVVEISWSVVAVALCRA